MADDTEKLKNIEAMFVQTARGLTAGKDAVTLNGLAPATVFFSDRPRRVVGHLSAQKFVDFWGAGENSFAADPPNAVLCYLGDAGGTPEDTIVVLREPRLNGDYLTYKGSRSSGALFRTRQPQSRCSSIHPGARGSPRWRA